MYQRSVRIYKHEKYQILTTELYHPVKSFDKKLYICETFQIVCKKMALVPTPDKLKDFKK